MSTIQLLHYKSNGDLSKIHYENNLKKHLDTEILEKSLEELSNGRGADVFESILVVDTEDEYFDITILFSNTQNNEYGYEWEKNLRDNYNLIKTNNRSTSFGDFLIIKDKETDKVEVLHYTNEGISKVKSQKIIDFMSKNYDIVNNKKKNKLNDKKVFNF